MVDFQTRVQELEKEVTRLREDREHLYRDLENALLQNEGSFWSSSSVLYQRIAQAEMDLESTQKEREQLVGQVSNLKEDVAQLRDMKRAADAISKKEMEKNQVLERELAFYKQRGAHWLEEKNQHLYEVEELKRTNVDLERGVNEARAGLEHEKTEREIVERRLTESNRKVGHLEERLVECARIPELEEKLRVSKDEAQALRKNIEEMEAELESRQNTIDTTQGDLAKSNETIYELEESIKILREESRARSVEASSRIKQLEEEVSQRTNEVAAKNEELGRADVAITSAKAQAEFAVADKEQELDEARVSYEAKFADLEMQLREKDDQLQSQQLLVQKATDEKIQALMKFSTAETEVEDLKGQLAAVGAEHRNGVSSPVKSNGAQQTGKGTWW